MKVSELIWVMDFKFVFGSVATRFQRHLDVQDFFLLVRSTCFLLPEKSDCLKNIKKLALPFIVLFEAIQGFYDKNSLSRDN